MINKVLEYAAKWAIGGKILAGLAWANDKLKGNRSELLIAIAALAEVLKLTGLIEAATASAILGAVLPALPVTLAEKVSKAVATVDRIAPALPKPENPDAPKA